MLAFATVLGSLAIIVSMQRSLGEVILGGRCALKFCSLSWINDGKVFIVKTRAIFERFLGKKLDCTCNIKLRHLNTSYKVRFLTGWHKVDILAFRLCRRPNLYVVVPERWDEMEPGLF